MFRYFAVNKPFGMLCQFSKEGDHHVLSQLDFVFPKDVYPVGRLDGDSEGLLLLTNDPSVNKKLLNPLYKHKRTYLVQVEGAITEEACSLLSQGVQISIEGKKYNTIPCTAEVTVAPENLPERNPPIRFRKSIPTSWLLLELTEGKNRQVRKMTAAVGFPTLRLIRQAIEGLPLDGLLPGEVREFQRADFFEKLKIR